MRSWKLGMLAATCTVLLAACGSGSPIITPPPPAGGFSNASLSGKYAFSMSGLESVSGARFARIGSLLADGSGHINGGIEDVLNLSTGAPASLVTFTNGTYQIQSNGRGRITLNLGIGGSLQLSFSAKSGAQGSVIQEGFLVQSDGATAANGTLNLQTPADFSGNSINGNYVFDFSGVSFAGASPSVISLIGQFAGDGNGNLTGGTIDVNDSSSTPSGAASLAASTYQVDTNGNGANFGRGMATLDGRTYAFYIVSNTRIKFLEEDHLGGTSGEAILQTGLIPAQNPDLKGSFVFLTRGSVTSGNFGPITRAGRFTSDASGGIGAVTFDENNDGNYSHLSQNSSLSNASYMMDTAHPGSGRGTFTFHNSSIGTLTFVFYFYSPSKAVIQDITASSVADGSMLAQTSGPFMLSGLAGNYALDWGGVRLVAPSSFAENFVGQGAQSNTASSNLSGAVDFVELGLNSINNGVTLDAGVSGTLTLSGDGTQNNGYKIAVGGNSPFTINFQAYIVDNGTLLLLCSDSNRTTAGLAILQTP